MKSIASAAGATVMRIRERGFERREKHDRTPVTEADHAAEALILAGLTEHFPGYAVVAEEEVCAGRVPADLGSRFFLVDPIDGTREFVDGRAEFTVNIALVEAGRTVAGVVFAPALGALYSGADGKAARTDADGTIHPIAVRAPRSPPTALASRSHRTAETDRFLAEEGVVDIVACGSSLKFCRVAEGAADLYPCFGPTMQWDTAAGQAVLEAAGGSVRDTSGAGLRYGSPLYGIANDFRNPFFVARGLMPRA